MFKLTSNESAGCRYMLKQLNKVATDSYFARVSTALAKKETFQTPNSLANNVAKIIQEDFCSNRKEIAKLTSVLTGEDIEVALKEYQQYKKEEKEKLSSNSEFPLMPFLILNVKDYGTKRGWARVVLSYETDRTFCWLSRSGHKANMGKEGIIENLIKKQYYVNEDMALNEIFIDALPAEVFEKQLSQLLPIFYLSLSWSN